MTDQLNRRSSDLKFDLAKWQSGCIQLCLHCLRIFTIVLFGAAVFLPHFLASQPVSHSFKHYTTHDGLAGVVNTAIFQDSSGYIWIGGTEGVSVYNGYEFNAIENYHSFSTEHIYSISEDHKGRIIILSETHLTRYNGKTFESFSLPFNAIGGLFIDFIPNKIIFRIGGAERDKIFEFTDNSFHQLDFSAGDTSEQIALSTNERLIGSSGIQGQTRRIFYIADGQDYRTIIAGDVFYKDDITGINKIFPNRYLTIYEYGSNPVRYIAANVKSGELKVHDSLGEIYREYKSRHLIHKNPPDKEGYFIYNSGRDEYFPIPDFETDVVRHAFEDRDGRLWVMSNTGVYKFFLNGIMRLEEEPALYSWGVSEWQNRLLFHTYLDGLATFEDDQWSYIPNKFSNGEIFPGRAASSEEFHFVPAWDGVFGLDKEFQPFFLNTERFAEGLWVDSVENELLAGDFLNLYFFDLEDLSLRKKVKLPPHALRIGIYSIVKRGDLIWLAGPGGIISYKKQADEFLTFTFGEGNLPCKSSTNLFIDEWNDLWATANCGLLWWNEGNKSFEKLPHSGSLGALVDMIPLGNNRYLISSNIGLFVIELERTRDSENQAYSFKVLKKFNHRNGFGGIKPFLSGFYRDSLKRIWVPTTTGTYVVNSDNLKLESSASLMRLLSIGNRFFGFDSPAASVVNLEYGSRNVDIAFDMVAFDWPGQPQFQFRTTGQKVWSSPQTERVVRLMDLDHGMHKVMIRPVFSDRQEKDWPVLTAQLQVNLPIWERNWFPVFILAVVLLSAVAIFASLLYNWRMRLKHFQTHNQLQLLQIHALESQLDPHFIFNVLTNIQNKVLMKQPEAANKMLVDLSKLMRKFLNSIESGLDHSSVLSRVSLTNELELIRLYMDFEKIKYENSFDYEIAIDPAIDPDSIVIFPMLPQPFIENAIKHGFDGIEEKGFLQIKINPHRDGLVIEITDNGIGRVASLKKRENSTAPGKSKGHLLVSRRVELLRKLGHNVSLDIRDLKRGTSVRIYTPVF